MKRALFRKGIYSLLTIDKQRNNPLARWCSYLATDYLNVYKNENYEITQNGEQWLLSQIARQYNNPTLFDVGANCGEWSKMAVNRIPSANIHAFELCEPTAKKLSINLQGISQVSINNCGLSDTEKKIEVNYVPEMDTLSSTQSIVVDLDLEIQKIKAKVMKGDDYCKQKNIDHIHFLKIDVEGAEPDVLRGFKNLLKNNAIDCIQFEYGRVNILNHFLLHDFYQMLEPYGYELGKLYPEKVALKAYDYQDEDFLGPNYVAIHKKSKLYASLCSN